jgi:hypothetical protein
MRMPEQTGLYREEALKRRLSPEPLDRLLQVTSPVSWLALGGLGLLIILAIAWSIVGAIPTRVRGQGLLIREGGVSTVYAASAGQISALDVAVGTAIAPGQAIAQVADPDSGKRASVSSVNGGTVLELMVRAGDLVQPGTPLLSLIDETQDLQALIYVPPAAGKRIQVGMPALISPVTTPGETYGSLRGTVKSVGGFPSTEKGMLRLLGNDNLVTSIIATTQGAPIEIVIALHPDPATASGYTWTSPSGPPFSIQSGTPVNAAITISEQRPISLVLPILR